MNPVQAWTVAANPAWAGLTPGDGPFEPACHDRSHMLDVVCCCGATMHIHETQIAGQEHAEIGATCKSCGELLLFAPGQLHNSFAEMRKQGWIK